jgi:hypothetical protein
MADTTRERYAVVSCHVERPLDDEVWARFSSLQARHRGGFRIAALMRPPDPGAEEDEARWFERARTAAALGPVGHHTHWTAPDHARPTAGGTGERVLAEGRRLRELGLEPKLFCGGGWYTDTEVAEACAELGYVDCTPRASRPPYLGAGERWAQCTAPAHIRLPSGLRVTAIPTTHSLGDVARSPFSLPRVAHLYFHDTDLVDGRRRRLIAAALRLLSLRARATDLDALVASLGEGTPEIEWADVERL